MAAVFGDDDAAIGEIGGDLPGVLDGGGNVQSPWANTTGIWLTTGVRKSSPTSALGHTSAVARSDMNDWPTYAEAGSALRRNSRSFVTPRLVSMSGRMRSFGGARLPVA